VKHFVFVVAGANNQLSCGSLDVDSEYLYVSELCNAYITRWQFFDYSFEQLNLIWQFEYCVGLLDNSQIANSRTGHLADWSTRGLDKSRIPTMWR